MTSVTSPDRPARSCFRAMAPCAFALYLTMTVISLAPVSFHPGSVLPTYPEMYLQHAHQLRFEQVSKNWDMDTGIAIWAYHWNLHQLFRNPANLFQANIYYPYPNTLAMADNFLGIALLGLPVHWLAGNPMLTYNCILFLTCSLTGLAMFGYIRAKTASGLAGLAAGAMMVALPYHYAHVATIHRTMLASFPLTLWLTDRYLDRHRVRDVVALAGILAYQVICTWYIAIALATLFSGYVLFNAFVRPRALFRKRLIIDGAVVCAIVLPVAAFMARPYFALHEAIPAFERSIQFELRNAVAPSDYFAIYEPNLVHGRRGLNLLPVHPQLRAYFPGLTTATMTVAGLLAWWMKRRRASIERRVVTFWIIAGAMAFVLSLGTYLQIGERNIPLPYLLLYLAIPPLKALKASQAYATIALFCGVALAGFGVAHFLSRAARYARWPWALTAVIIVGAQVESLRPGLQTMTVPLGQDIPEAHRWLARQPGAPVAATLLAAPTPETNDQMELAVPRVKFYRPKFLSMHYSIFHFKPILEGHTSYIPPASGSYIHAIGNFPSPDTVELLQAMNADYLLIALDKVDRRLAQAVEHELAPYEPLHLAERFADSLVYRVLPLPQPSAPLVVSARWPNQPDSADDSRQNARTCLLRLYNPAEPRIILYPARALIQVSIGGRCPSGVEQPELSVEITPRPIMLRGQSIEEEIELPADWPADCQLIITSIHSPLLPVEIAQQ